MAQERAYVRFPNHCYLIIDSDICLNEDFLQQINQFNIEDNSIYGASRYLYSTVNDYITKRPPIFWKRKLTKKIIGYFQMYKSAFFYKDSFDCSMCDMNFAKLFTNRILLPFNVNHIGNIIENWKGRNVN